MVHVRGVNERASSGLPAAFPSDVHHGIILFIGAAGDDAIGLQPQNRAVAQLHTADEIIPRRNNHFAAAGNRAGVQRLLEGGSVLVRAVSHSAEIADVEYLWGRCLLRPAGRREEPERGQEQENFSFHPGFVISPAALLPQFRYRLENGRMSFRPSSRVKFCRRNPSAQSNPQP